MEEASQLVEKLVAENEELVEKVINHPYCFLSTVK